MLVLVCGSRTWTDRQLVDRELCEFLRDRFATILHGGAKGADSMADEIAHENGFDTKVMLADWKRYGRSAGCIRNDEMLDEGPDLVLAFWDGSSHGTKHTIDQAITRGIPVKIIFPQRRA